MNFFIGTLLIAAQVVATLAYPEACACFRNIRPVCGSDGVTYHNECLLNCATKDEPSLSLKHEGPCSDTNDLTPSCDCDYELNQVCGSDKQTYDNACLLNCATINDPGLSILHSGACADKVKVVDIPDLCMCTREMKPVCGSDGVTYNNDCLLNCATIKDSRLSIKYYGPCADQVKVVDGPTEFPSCSCTREKKPVCGSDGVTYNNDCLLNCATADDSMLSIRYYGPCADKVKVVDGPTEFPSCVCTREMKPVCGSNGVTYNNDCLLNCATANDSRLSIKYYGPCADDVIIVEPGFRGDDDRARM